MTNSITLSGTPDELRAIAEAATITAEDHEAASAAIMQAAVDMDADTPAPDDADWLAKHFAAHRKRAILALLDRLAALEAERAAIASTRPDSAWSSDLSAAPHACHVLAARFNDDVGDWAMGVVASPPIYPYTHWRMVDTPDARQPSRADDALRTRLQNWRDNLAITRGNPVVDDYLHGPALDFVIEQLDGLLSREALASEKPTADKGD